MGLLGLFLAESLQRQNGLKNVLAGIVNLVAAVVLHRHHAHRLGRGRADRRRFGVGGLLGARIGRRLSPTVLRATIVVVGIAAVVKLLA